MYLLFYKIMSLHYIKNFLPSSSPLSSFILISIIIIIFYFIYNYIFHNNPRLTVVVLCTLLSDSAIDIKFLRYIDCYYQKCIYSKPSLKYLQVI